MTKSPMMLRIDSELKLLIEKKAAAHEMSINKMAELILSAHYFEKDERILEMMDELKNLGKET